MLIDRRTSRRLMNQINVVPYIDVMLVLLVIFMITAPLINPGQVELPSIGKTSDPPMQPMEVGIQADGTLLFRDLARLELSARPSGRERVLQCAEVAGGSGTYNWAAFHRAVRGEKLEGEVEPETVVAGLRVMAAAARSEQSGLPARV